MVLDIRKSIPDIGKSFNHFPISEITFPDIGNYFRISGIKSQYPTSGNQFPISGKDFPISGNQDSS